MGGDLGSKLVSLLSQSKTCPMETSKLKSKCKYDYRAGGTAIRTLCFNLVESCHFSSYASFPQLLKYKLTLLDYVGVKNCPYTKLKKCVSPRF